MLILLLKYNEQILASPLLFAATEFDCILLIRVKGGPLTSVDNESNLSLQHYDFVIKNMVHKMP